LTDKVQSNEKILRGGRDLATMKTQLQRAEQETRKYAIQRQDLVQTLEDVQTELSRKDKELIVAAATGGGKEVTRLSLLLEEKYITLFITLCIYLT
jgi:hypothetical protein